MKAASLKIKAKAEGTSLILRVARFHVSAPFPHGSRYNRARREKGAGDGSD
jgi:hypothetical protein